MGAERAFHPESALWRFFNVNLIHCLFDGYENKAIFFPVWHGI